MEIMETNFSPVCECFENGCNLDSFTINELYCKMIALVPDPHVDHVYTEKHFRRKLENSIMIILSSQNVEVYGKM